mgnify:CR=1 FL=1
MQQLSPLPRTITSDALYTAIYDLLDAAEALELIDADDDTEEACLLQGIDIARHLVTSNEVEAAEPLISHLIPQINRLIRTA